MKEEEKLSPGWKRSCGHNVEATKVSGEQAGAQRPASIPGLGWKVAGASYQLCHDFAQPVWKSTTSTIKGMGVTHPLGTSQLRHERRCCSLAGLKAGLGLGLSACMEHTEKASKLQTNPGALARSISSYRVVFRVPGLERLWRKREGPAALLRTPRDATTPAGQRALFDESPLSGLAWLPGQCLGHTQTFLATLSNTQDFTPCRQHQASTNPTGFSPKPPVLLSTEQTSGHDKITHTGKARVASSSPMDDSAGVRPASPSDQSHAVDAPSFYFI